MQKVHQPTSRSSLQMIGAAGALGIAACVMPVAAQENNGTHVDRVAMSVISPAPFGREHDSESLVIQSRASMSAHGMARHAVQADHHVERRDHRDHRNQRLVFPGFLYDYDWGYWNGLGYGPDYCAYGGCGETAPMYGNAGGPSWDFNNHSPALEIGSIVGGQPSALIIAVTPQEGSEHDRAWIARCEPRISFDNDGVPRYFYNGRRGCASGQWAD